MEKDNKVIKVDFKNKQKELKPKLLESGSATRATQVKGIPKIDTFHELEIFKEEQALHEKAKTWFSEKDLEEFMKED